jgi:hypothetical protein
LRKPPDPGRPTIDRHDPHRQFEIAVSPLAEPTMPCTITLEPEPGLTTTVRFRLRGGAKLTVDERFPEPLSVADVLDTLRSLSLHQPCDVTMHLYGQTEVGQAWGTTTVRPPHPAAPAPDPAAQVAVWRLHYGRADYDLCDDEDDAVTVAVALTYDDRILGVQYPDGRTVPAGQWDNYRQALAAYSARRDQARAEYVRPPMRRARDPFIGQHVDIEVSEPDWIGRPE